MVYLASIGVLLSTFICGSLLWLITYYINIKLSYLACLIFGAIISPTDALAVISVFKNVYIVPKYIQTRVIGEALFNDAVGIIVLVTLVQIFNTSYDMDFIKIGLNLLVELFGGIFFGWIIGVLTSAVLKQVNDNEIAILTTLTASGLGYLIAQSIHVSGIITMVIAGLFVGGNSRDNNFSKATTLALSNFWELTDDILNGLLFVLIGLEMLTISFNITVILVGIIALIIIFVARYISLYLPDLILIKIFKTKIRAFSSHKERLLMSWGGVRGGISIALAWSITNISPKLLAITYVVVVASILIQGSSLNFVIKKLYAKT